MFRLLLLVVLISLNSDGRAYAQSPFDLLDRLMDSARQGNQRGNRDGRSSQPSRSRFESELSAAQMRRLQTALRDLNHYQGKIDGRDGPATREAVAAWARARGWAAPQTLKLAHLQSMENELGTRGGSGSTVAGVQPDDVVARSQRALSALGYDPGPFNGQMNSQTAAAIVAWARDRGWKAPDALREAHVQNMEDEVDRNGVAAAPEPSGGDVALIRRAQVGLIVLGYDPGTTSGEMVEKTRSALAKWARDRGWNAPNSVRLAHVENIESEANNRVTSNAGLLRWEVKNELYDGLLAQGCTDKYSEACLMVVCDPGVGLAFRLSSSTSAFDKVDRVALAVGRQFAMSLAVDKIQDLTPLGPDHLKAFLASAKQNPLLTLAVGNESLMIGLRDSVSKVESVARACKSLMATYRSAADPFGGKFQRLDGEADAELNWSAERNGRLTKMLLPPAAGPGPVVDNAAGWRADDVLAGYQRRVREAAKPLGGNCATEETTLNELARGLDLSFDDAAEGRVGDGLSLKWGNNNLADRIPVWVMVSSRQPMRFKGRGHIALGPDAPNPFGIKTGLGEHRALVALAARGADRAGEVRFVPLQEGRLDLTLSVVGYLRSCEQEIVLRREQHDIAVTPADAKIVLNTVEGRAAYTHRIEVPKYKRTILFNETRFLLLDSETGTEIVQRQGSNLQLSPTHRFIDVGEIVDILDGETVAPHGATHWVLEDSFAISGSAPWGKVDISSTFGDYLAVREQLTGASCCDPEVGATRIGIDLENAAYTVWGRLGHRIGALQNDRIHLIENSPGGYSSEARGNSMLFHSFLASLGMVSPVSLAPTFDAAGGFAAAWREIYEAEKPELTFEEKLDKRLAMSGLKASVIERASRGPTMATSELGANSVPLELALPDQLRRLGIETMAMTDGETLLGTTAPDGRGFETFIGDADVRMERAGQVMDRFAKEAKTVGWKIEWSLPDPMLTMPECDHLGLGEIDGSDSGNRSALLAPRDVDVVNRAETAKGAIWVAQSFCSAGATFGSLRSFSVLYLMDTGEKRPAKREGLLVESVMFGQNAARPVWYDGPMRIKANDDLVLTYAPRAGSVSVWNRRDRKFVYTRDNLPDGGLLLGAWLLEDGKHLVQLNSDGNIFVHALTEKGAPLLFGRIIDDEIAVWTADFRYDATAEAQALIDLKFPGHNLQYSLDRFGASLRVAGLGPATLGGQEMQALSPDIAVPPVLGGTASADANGEVSANLTFDSKRVAQILVFQDGVQTDALPQKGLTEYRFGRLKDARAAAIFATDADGLASLPLTVTFEAPAKAASVRRALIVGVNTYANEKLPSLNYALADAERVAIALGDAGGPSDAFGDIIALKDRRASPDAILESVDRLLAGLEKGDHAVIFFAGHGLRDASGEFYLATSATDPDKLADTALPFGRLRERLAGSLARITLLLDTCHSGSVGDGLFATSDELVTDLAGVPSNLTIVAASKGRQVSLETADAGGGLFSTAVANVLGKERARFDTNENGAIEASEFYRGVKTEVVAGSKGEQTPWVVRSRMVGDYALF